MTQYHDLIGHEVTHDDSTGRVTLTLQRQEGGANTSSFGVTIRESDARVIAAKLVPPYNGWTNWETWNANLWLTNDDDTYRMARELAARALQDRHGEDAFVDFVEEVAYGMGSERPASLGTDLLRECLTRINYREIVDGLTQD